MCTYTRMVGALWRTSASLIVRQPAKLLVFQTKHVLMKDDTRVISWHLSHSHAHAHTHTHRLLSRGDRVRSSAYLVLCPELLQVGGVLGELLPLRGVGQDVDGGLRLLEPLEEGLQLAEGPLQALQLTVQLGLPVARPGTPERPAGSSQSHDGSHLMHIYISMCACVCVRVRLPDRPVVDAVPGGVVFVRDLFDPPGVVDGILPEELIGQIVEARHAGLASTQVLQEGLCERERERRIES